jgi:UDP:flavonoid glycosyltransferase YjiC (YdhE family)
MRRRHVAFIVEPSYGHLVSVVGIATRLLCRGYRVSVATSMQFAGATRAIGAEAFVYRPSMSKNRMLADVLQPDGSYSCEVYDPREERWSKQREAEWKENRCQIELLYKADIPALVIYDGFIASFAKELASSWGAFTVMHSPLMIDPGSRYDDALVIVTLPKLFQSNASTLDSRFQFVGFIPDGRKRFFSRWEGTNKCERVILVSATTGLLPELQFFERAISAFADVQSGVVLSVGRHLDPDRLTQLLPQNFEVNRDAANFEILEHACLFVGQGGQGSVLEAMYHGVPALLVPPIIEGPFEPVVRRVEELGVGMRLGSRVAPGELRKAADFIVYENSGMHERLKEVREIMRHEAVEGASRAVDLIETLIN